MGEVGATSCETLRKAKDAAAAAATTTRDSAFGGGAASQEKKGTAKINDDG